MSQKLIRKVVELHTLKAVKYAPTARVTSYSVEEWFTWLNEHDLLAAWMTAPEQHLKDLLSFEDNHVKVLVLNNGRIYFTRNNAKDWL